MFGGRRRDEHQQQQKSQHQQKQPTMFAQHNNKESSTTTAKVVLNKSANKPTGGTGGEQQQLRSPRRPLLSRESLGISPSPKLPARPTPEPSVEASTSSTSSSVASSSRASTGRASTLMFCASASSTDLPSAPASPFGASSPVHSPQWRLPSASVGGGGGRAMPKSALLMSRLSSMSSQSHQQASLLLPKQTSGVVPNLDTGTSSQQMINASASTTGQRDDQPSPPVRSLLPSAVKAIGSHTSSVGASSSSSSAVIVTDANSSSSSATANRSVPELSSVIERRTAAAAADCTEMGAGECIFNFEDVFFEEQLATEDGGGREEREQGTEEQMEVLRWTQVQEHFKERRIRRRIPVEGDEEAEVGRGRRLEKMEGLEEEDEEGKKKEGGDKEEASLQSPGRAESSLGRRDEEEASSARRADEKEETALKRSIDDEADEERSDESATLKEEGCSKEEKGQEEGQREDQSLSVQRPLTPVDDDANIVLIRPSTSSSNPFPSMSPPNHVEESAMEEQRPVDEAHMDEDELRRMKQEKEEEESGMKEEEEDLIGKKEESELVRNEDCKEEEEEEEEQTTKDDQIMTEIEAHFIFEAAHDRMEETHVKLAAPSSASCSRSLYISESAKQRQQQQAEEKTTNSARTSSPERMKKRNEAKEGMSEEEIKAIGHKQEEKIEEAVQSEEGQSPNRPGTDDLMRPEGIKEESLMREGLKEESALPEMKQSAKAEEKAKKRENEESGPKEEEPTKVQPIVEEGKDAVKRVPAIEEPPKEPKRPHQHKRGGKRRSGLAPPPLSSIASFDQPGPSSAVPDTPSSAGYSISSSSALPSCSSFTSTRVPISPPSSATSRVIERLRIGGLQLRNVKSAHSGAQLVVGIRLDGREVYRSAAVQLSGGCCSIGEGFSLDELAQQRHFQTVQLSLFELLDGARQQRVLGRLKLSRKELFELGEQAQQDRWLPIQRVRTPSDGSSEVLLGSLCADVGWEAAGKVLTLKVLDLTVWTLASGRENPLARHCRDGRLHLKVRVAFDRTAFTAMQKVRLSERRGLEQARFDCSRFFCPSTSAAGLHAPGQQHPPHSPRTTAAAEQSTAEWLSGLSACSSPACTPSWAPGSASKGPGGSRGGSRHFRFPPASPAPGGMVRGHQKSVSMGSGGAVREAVGTAAVAGAGVPTAATGTGMAEEPRMYIKLYGQPSGSQDSYCGSVRIGLDRERMQPRDLPRGPNWFNIFANLNMGKHSPHHHQHHQQQQKSADEALGEIRFKIWYNMDEVLPLAHYQPLYMNLTRSLNSTAPHCSPQSSLISLIQCLPIDIENLAKPLMKIFIHSNQIRPFFRLICSEHVASCSDVNTLFRSQSLASKVMYEMMQFVGNKYVVTTLKPLIDLIFAERKPCEIDPSKLKPGESLEQNFRNLTVYAELAFSRVVESRRRCPQVLRELFAELRNVVEHFFPGREDVARLALSSFLIMRFFAAAILNPRLFMLKLETPDVDVSRTLVLVSKILQRLANCVVSAHPLTTKELWLAPLLRRFSDDAHKAAMVNFLDQISAPTSGFGGEGGQGTHQHHQRRSAMGELEDHIGGDEEEEDDQGLLLYNNENVLPPSTPTFCEPTVLKSGYLIERRFGPVKKRASFKNFIHPKRRLVVLTESMLNWQKASAKDGTASTAGSNNGTLTRQPQPTQQQQQQHFLFGGAALAAVAEQKSQIPLAEITSVSAIGEAKNSFRVATVNTEVHFQAGNESDMNEWIIQIQKQHRLYLMSMNRPSLDPGTHGLSPMQAAAAGVDIERELHTVYTQLADHLDTLCLHGWCCRPGCNQQQHHHHLHQQQ